MAIVVGDVVEIGLSDSSGGVQKVLGVVEHDDGDTLRVLTGCLPTPVRDVPRVSLRRVWGSAQVHWGTENTTEVSSVTRTIQRRARRKALGMTEGSSSGITTANAPRASNVSSSDDLDDEADGGWSFDTVESGARRPKRPVYANPLRLACGVLADLCSWRDTWRSVAFLLAVELFILPGVVADSHTLRAAGLLARLTVLPIATTLLCFAVLTSQPSGKCSSAWILVLLAILGFAWLTNSLVGVHLLVGCHSCCYFLRQAGIIA